MKRTVLLVEDNEDIALINQEAFVSDGFGVYTAHTLAQARALLAEADIRLIVLDILLPDGSGLDFCRALRRESLVPVLFLTALGEKRQIIDGITAGGDDYLAKPYDLDELVARANALIRRAAWGVEAVPRHVVGDLMLNMQTMRAFLGGEDARLTYREFLLLAYLLERRGQFVRAEALYANVWGQDAQDQTATVRVHVNRLRGKICLPEYPYLRIESKYGAGYRML